MDFAVVGAGLDERVNTNGDPRSSSVVLWTRITLAAGTGTFASVSLRVQVSSDAMFGTLIVDQPVMTAQATDHTVRVAQRLTEPTRETFKPFTA